MTEEAEVATSESTTPARPASQERVRDVSGRGKWHGTTGRYIPVGGGSRTKVPVNDDPEVPRYAGMLGIDPEQSEGIQTIAGLYSHMGGIPVVKPGKAAKFLGEILERKAKPKVEDDGLMEL